MIDILIWGIGSASTKVENIINTSNVNVLAYIDNDEQKQGKLINNRLVINPKKINEHKYEYIFVASQFYCEIYKQLIALGVDNRKILNSYNLVEKIIELEHIKSDKRYLYTKLKDNYNKAKIENIDTLITGISYAECGIDLSLFKYNAVNLALSGQDLYYDYNLAKNIIEFNKRKIKNVIIGLCYYSFQYDLSLSNGKTRCIYVYKDILNLIHNYDKDKDDKAELLKWINKPMEIDRNLYLDNTNIILQKLKVNFEVDFNKNWANNFENMSFDDRIKEGKNLAILDSNKNYPKTVIENKRILSKYLKCLNSNGISVTIVIFPVTKYYSKNFDRRLKKEFYEIIEELNIDYDFTFLDCFNSNEFKDMDFSDCSHLNVNGARKFTKILNEKI
ncbi:MULTISPECIES: hypothetical protein [unclassified Clostridium]|uniref:hypothetical protein n=1 Tax=unclassified Clostridium TaxID=2614128 RepID=UPI0002980B8C|nr:MULTISPECIES: hypothetical protein [unclassified Clostridium]EKQ51115.1 MAG: hypothetical protein A370_05142 [Clostridium sp. Maddingley MBC34-26]